MPSAQAGTGSGPHTLGQHVSALQFGAQIAATGHSKALMQGSPTACMPVNTPRHADIDKKRFAAVNLGLVSVCRVTTHSAGTAFTHAAAAVGSKWLVPRRATPIAVSKSLCSAKRITASQFSRSWNCPHLTAGAQTARSNAFAKSSSVSGLASGGPPSGESEAPPEQPIEIEKAAMTRTAPKDPDVTRGTLTRALLGGEGAGTVRRGGDKKQQ